MKIFVQIACLLLLAECVLAQGKGIKPRTNPSDFPANATSDGLTVAAAQLSATQVAHAFATDLHDGYIVVEVAVYPPNGEITIDPDNFFLHVEGSKTVLRPAAPDTIAAILQKPTGRDVTLYPVATVGYESGPYGNGVTTGVGMGVGISAKEQKSDADRKVMETELSDKALPSGTFAKPVGGYLYFPVSSTKKARYVLSYNEGELNLSIPLPQAPK
jgi:hypothetical protein